MKRVFVVFGEFSGNGTDFRIIQNMEVFSTYKKAVEYAKNLAEKSRSKEVREELPESGWVDYAYRITWKTDCETRLRFTVYGRNMNNNY